MFFTRIYRKIVPTKFRKMMYRTFLKGYFKVYDNLKFKFIYGWFSIFPTKSDKVNCMKFMGKNGITNCPYPFSLEYTNKSVESGIDERNGLPFVLHNGRKLYFKKMPIDQVVKAYRVLLMEQDNRSAHCYTTDYTRLKDKVVVDAGTAEGIFSLNAIDYASHIYMFECEKDWIEPLKATFEPMKDKITIVEKYINNKTEGNNITLDDFFSDKNADNLYLKMDIEGFERDALIGCEKLFEKSKSISGAICTYHLDEDEKIISSFLNKKGCKFAKTEGYLYNERTLRTGLLLFSK